MENKIRTNHKLNTCFLRFRKSNKKYDGNNKNNVLPRLKDNQLNNFKLKIRTLKNQRFLAPQTCLQNERVSLRFCGATIPMAYLNI